MADISKDDIIEAVKKMTVLEVSELVKAMEEEFGVSAAPVAVAGAPVASGDSDEADEKSEFDIILVSAGQQKVKVIKEVKTLTGLGLKEAKALCDEGGQPIKEGVPKAEAEEIKAKLEEVGATVELK